MTEGTRKAPRTSIPGSGMGQDALLDTGKEPPTRKIIMIPALVVCCPAVLAAAAPRVLYQPVEKVIPAASGPFPARRQARRRENSTNHRDSPSFSLLDPDETFSKKPRSRRRSTSSTDCRPLQSQLC